MSDLSNNHWTCLHYRQRMTTAQWRKCLLECDTDCVLFQGEIYELKAKRLGAGVVEVRKVKKKYNDKTGTFG